MGLGMMIEHVRPFSLSLAYCVGKETCDMPTGVEMSEIEMGEQPHAVMLDQLDKIDWHAVMEDAPEVSMSDDSDVQEVETEASCEAPTHHVCPRCMKHAMRHVMGFVLEKVKHMCEASKCPKMQRMCRVARAQRSLAFGMLLAKVEP